MCGIVGAISNEISLGSIINMLKHVEYRGYDSSGIAYWQNGDVFSKKSVGAINCLEQNINLDQNTNCAIAHTRWATHGEPSQENAHPHHSCNGTYYVVHNGIIENFSELKKELILKGATFYSNTDTEVIANLLQYSPCTSVKEKLIDACSKLKGSYAIAVICKHNKKTIYVAKQKSPLYIAKSSLGTFIASDPICFSNLANNYYSLEDGEFATLNQTEIVFFTKFVNINKTTSPILDFDTSCNKNNYQFFMEKEINEAPKSLRALISFYTQYNPLFAINLKLLKSINNVKIIGCGTAYHSALIGAQYIQQFAKIEASAYIASEFRYSNPLVNKNTLYIFVSQSGETADTLASLELCKKLKAKTIAITNVAYSSITKLADIILPICAGKEIAVASTKAYVNQLAVFYCLARHIKNTLTKQKYNFLTDIEKVVKKYKIYSFNELQDLVNLLKIRHDAFFIGRGTDYVTANEASLKLKEISYINSSAYASGELKHGFLALIEQGSYVFAIITNKKLLSKSLNGAHEAMARGANIILVSQFSLNNSDIKFFKQIKLPRVKEELMPLISISPMQSLALYTSIAKGNNPDKPRNLAKSVTVE